MLKVGSLYQIIDTALGFIRFSDGMGCSLPKGTILLYLETKMVFDGKEHYFFYNNNKYYRQLDYPHERLKELI